MTETTTIVPPDQLAAQAAAEAEQHTLNLEQRLETAKYAAQIARMSARRAFDAHRAGNVHEAEEHGRRAGIQAGIAAAADRSTPPTQDVSLSCGCVMTILKTADAWYPDMTTCALHRNSGRLLSELRLVVELIGHGQTIGAAHMRELQTLISEAGSF